MCVGEREHRVANSPEGIEGWDAFLAQANRILPFPLHVPI